MEMRGNGRKGDTTPGIEDEWMRLYGYNIEYVKTLEFVRDALGMAYNASGTAGQPDRYRQELEEMMRRISDMIAEAFIYLVRQMELQPSWVEKELQRRLGETHKGSDGDAGTGVEKQ